MAAGRPQGSPCWARQAQRRCTHLMVPGPAKAWSSRRLGCVAAVPFSMSWRLCCPLAAAWHGRRPQAVLGAGRCHCRCPARHPENPRGSWHRHWGPARLPSCLERPPLCRRLSRCCRRPLLLEQRSRLAGAGQRPSCECWLAALLVLAQARAWSGLVAADCRSCGLACDIHSCYTVVHAASSMPLLVHTR